MKILDNGITWNELLLQLNFEMLPVLVMFQKAVLFWILLHLRNQGLCTAEASHPSCVRIPTKHM